MSIGILLANIGTPDAPTTKAVRRYLKEFLSDPRVIEVPSLIWQPFLHAILLRRRPQQSAKLYEKIWTPQGSPLLYHSLEIATQLEVALREQLQTDVHVQVGMRYGNPSIASALRVLKEKNVDKLLVFPLYPQYSATTTASTFDAIAAVFKKWRHLPTFRMLTDYALDPAYITAIVDSIRDYWAEHGKRYLLFSFHGIPQRYVDNGDPYATHCHASATAIAEALALRADEWSLSFQSRLGPTQWLKPYTDIVLTELPKRQIKHIHVICAGFPVDCLETLEEIAIRGKEQFIEGGGEQYDYIPALNSTATHITALASMINKQITGW